MPLQTCLGASLQCSFGAAPSSLIVLPKGNFVTINGMLAANIMDYAPFVNILPFGMCSSLANPAVASATAAALGVLTPMPCVPVTVAPWSPGAMKTKVNYMPALPDSAMCMCSWGGVIKINYAGQVKVMVS